MANYLNAQLVPAMLTAAPNDYYASVINNGSIGPAGIIKLIKEDGIELNEATMMDVITRYNSKSAILSATGVNVDTGLVRMRSVVKGVFYEKSWNQQTNPVQTAITPGSIIRQANADTIVRIIGVKNDLMEIISVTDFTSGLSDGTLTKGRNAELRGTYLKVAGDSEAVGVYFRNTGTDQLIKLESGDIILNEPSRLLLLIPAILPEGEYELTITTQYSGGGKFLKTPRTAGLSFPVVVV